MATKMMQRIEFFGGPLDGHVESCPQPRKPFVAIETTVSARQTSSFTALLHWLFFHRSVPPRVFAIYELQARDASCRYLYVRSSNRQDIQFSSAHVDTIVHSPP
ncbi:MAG: hypothetical protein ACF788_08200 [Novipirellula sp. JB048]